MRTRSAFNKDDLKIGKSDKVLDIGSGSNPTKRANVLLERSVHNNKDRRGDFKIYPHQLLVEGDGEQMPFRDKEFDYSICSHVIEHTQDPEKFMQELTRVSKQGYIEVPSLIGEILAPKESHKWVALEINKKLVFYEKNLIPYDFKMDMGDVFLNYLPYQSIAYRLLVMTRNNYHVVKLEWTGSIDYIINPNDEYLKSFFVENLTPNMVVKILPPFSLRKDLLLLLQAFLFFIKDKLSRFLCPKLPLNYEQYIEDKK